MTFKDILYDVSDGIARMTLNRPEKMNALTWGSWAEIETALRMAEENDAAKVVVITGQGRGFSAGTDLTEQASEEQLAARPWQGRSGRMRTRHLATAQVYHCQKPTIAAVNGAAVGAGLSLALACDIRIAAEAARFSAIFVKRAIVADTGSTWFLPRTVGMEQALKMLYTGRMVGAKEAREIGLVSEVVATEELSTRVTELATEITRGPSVAIELIKRLAHESMSTPLEQQIQQEEYLQGITWKTEDVKEGRQSFVEKRDPVFKGR